jgi:hypothetical protein
LAQLVGDSETNIGGGKIDRNGESLLSSMLLIGDSGGRGTPFHVARAGGRAPWVGTGDFSSCFFFLRVIAHLFISLPRLRPSWVGALYSVHWRRVKKSLFSNLLEPTATAETPAATDRMAARLPLHLYNHRWNGGPVAEWVVLRTFGSHGEAEVVRGLLMAEGVEAFARKRMSPLQGCQGCGERQPGPLARAVLSRAFGAAENPQSVKVWRTSRSVSTLALGTARGPKRYWATRSFRKNRQDEARAVKPFGKLRADRREFKAASSRRTPRRPMSHTDNPGLSVAPFVTLIACFIRCAAALQDIKKTTAADPR